MTQKIATDEQIEKMRDVYASIMLKHYADYPKWIDDQILLIARIESDKAEIERLRGCFKQILHDLNMYDDDDGDHCRDYLDSAIEIAKAEGRKKARAAKGE